MPDVAIPNVPAPTTSHQFAAIWGLSRAKKKAGHTVLASSDGTTKDTSGVAANDKWGGNADPLLDVYPSALDTVAAWILMEGAAVHKVSMSAAMSGSYVRGDTVTQATSGATGELVGYDFDGALNTTTVAAGSNGVNISTFAGAGVLNITSGNGFPLAGFVALPALGAIISYTGVTAGTLTGCTTVSGSGVLATGQTVNGSTGHAVILPRTGTFNGTNVITTGSGATFTPTSIDTLRTLVVFWKTTNTTSGSIYIQNTFNTAESASLFSTLMSSAGCTATVAPGGGGTGNALPGATTGTYVTRGGNTPTITHDGWFANTNATYAKAQIEAMNCTPAAGVSADGSWGVQMGDTSGGVGIGCDLISYQRVEDTEDGDLGLWVWVGATAHTMLSANFRVGAANTTNNFTATTTTFGSGLGTSTSAWIKGWRRRGMVANFNVTNTTEQCCGYAPGTVSVSGSGFITGDNTGNPDTISCSYAPNRRTRFRISLHSLDNTRKHNKGVLRWMWGIQGGVAYDTIDTRQKIALCIGSSGPFSSATIFWGKFDGISNPLQS